jgi:coenzyme F420 hydrogenase subunit beta
MSSPLAHQPVTPDAPFLSIAFSAKELCTRCGSCSGVCPTDAIKIGPDFYPELIADRCISCGLCGDICPGKEVRYGDLAEQVFGERFVDRGFDGWVEKTYVGFSTDERLRKGGAGGGVATGLLAYLLQSGAVEGCLVTRMNKDKPWLGEPFIARTYEELCQSQGSRYHTIPLNTLWAEMRRSPGRYAAAMLPCQTHGYRNLQKHDPELANMLHCVVGLFCGGALEPALTSDMLKVRGISREDIQDFQFRGGDWPGQMRAILKDGTARPLHYSNYKDGAYNYFTSLYMPERCQTCLDGSNEFADLSISDAWTRDEKGDYKFKEHSRILVRTARGAELLRTASESGTLVLKDVTTDPNYKTHKLQTKRKGALAPIRVERWKKSGKAVPAYDRTAPSDVSWRERLAERASSWLLSIGKHEVLRRWIMGFLTSKYAIPLTKIRLFLKRRKYARKAM